MIHKLHAYLVFISDTLVCIYKYSYHVDSIFITRGTVNLALPRYVRFHRLIHRSWCRFDEFLQATTLYRAILPSTRSPIHQIWHTLKYSKILTLNLKHAMIEMGGVFTKLNWPWFEVIMCPTVIQIYNVINLFT